MSVQVPLMQKSDMTYQAFWRPLTVLYPEREAQWIGRVIMEECYGLTQSDIIMGKVERLNEQGLTAIQQRLLKGEPIQYVVGWAAFGDNLFMVDPSVLIPRPETLWLCRAVSETIGIIPRSVLDIGTGSGCIAITIAIDRPTAMVTAWDISNDALDLARRNAFQLEADVDFVHQDALCPPNDHNLWNVIVSNPPYICRQEQTAMEHNVLDFEPHLALFVPDEDPLLYYRSIAHYAIQALTDDGTLFFEINPLYANELGDLLLDTGFKTVKIYQDDYDKDRYIIAWK
jgi:release factor glutamine methyltransferase